MSRWTTTRLAQHTTALLRDARLILVSNRAPYSHRWHSPAPLAPGADTPLVPGTTLWDGGWLHRLSAQLSRVLQGDHTLRWSQPAGGLTAALDPVMQAATAPGWPGGAAVLIDRLSTPRIMCRCHRTSRSTRYGVCG
jgi:trehalose-6-phosphate synthase